MIIYKDAETGDDLFSDCGIKIKEVDGLYYEVYAQVETTKEGFDDNLIGANPSAEEAAEENLADTKTGINVVHQNLLNATSYTKKDYGTLLKDYFKKGIDALGEVDDLNEIKARAQENCKKLYGMFKEIEFWVGASWGDGITAFSYYTSDKEVTMIFFKFGITSYKV